MAHGEHDLGDMDYGPIGRLHIVKPQDQMSALWSHYCGQYNGLVMFDLFPTQIFYQTVHA